MTARTGMSKGRPITGLTQIATPSVGGVMISHSLNQQAQRMVSINQRIGRRLDHWLRTHPDGLPDGEFIEVYRYYAATLVNLLKEQRERAMLGGSDVPVDQLVAQLRHEFVEAAKTFDEADLEALAQNLKPEAFRVLDRVRAERFGAGEWKAA